MLYHLVPQQAGSFLAHTEATTGTELPLSIKNGEFDTWLERGILVLGFHGHSSTGNDRFTAVNLGIRMAGLGRWRVYAAANSVR
jgi:hypothetical protein